MKKTIFLTTEVSDASGGAIYDKFFLKQLKLKNPDVKVLEDHSFKEFKGKRNFLFFALVYLRNFNSLIDCDLLIINSRLYTRFFLALILKKFSKKDYDLILIHHHYNFMTHNGFLFQIHKYFENSFLSKADYLIIPNPYIVGLTKKFNITKPDIVFLESSFKEKEYGVSKSNNKRILFVGNVEKRKGLEFGIKAFKIFSEEYPEYIFDVVGKYDQNSKYYKNLNKLIMKYDLDDKIIFSGRVSEQELELKYKYSDFFLFPSLNEGYGWVLIEAMAHGLPVIAFDNTAIPYTVKHGSNGMLAKNKNYNEMARLMVSLIDDVNNFEQLKKGALETYKRVNKLNNLEVQINEYLTKLFN